MFNTYKIKHSFFIPYFPQGNSQAEATNKMIIIILKIPSRIIIKIGMSVSCMLYGHIALAFRCPQVLLFFLSFTMQRLSYVLSLRSHPCMFRSRILSQMRSLIRLGWTNLLCLMRDVSMPSSIIRFIKNIVNEHLTRRSNFESSISMTLFSKRISNSPILNVLFMISLLRIG